MVKPHSGMVKTVRTQPDRVEYYSIAVCSRNLSRSFRSLLKHKLNHTRGEVDKYTPNSAYYRIKINAQYARKTYIRNKLRQIEKDKHNTPFSE